MHTELGGSQVEVQRCPFGARRVPVEKVQRCSLSSEGSRLRSSGAQCDQTLAVEVQQWPLRAEVGEELGEELARRIVDMEIQAEMVEEKEDKEEEEKKNNSDKI